MVTINSINNTTYVMKKNSFQGYILDEENGIIALIFATNKIYVSKYEFERIKGELM